MLSKLFEALGHTRSSLASAINIIKGRSVSAESMESLEAQLLAADIGIDTVDEILDVIKQYSKNDIESKIREYMISIMPECNYPKKVQKPTVIMMVGVNGTGKTTTTAKLASYYKQLDQNVMIVAADTYRAAGVEQLRVWSERVGTRLICNESTMEPSAVLFDGLHAARSSDTDVIIVDTAGRLHTYNNLMLELEKMERVVRNHFPDFFVSNLITMDASLGQNSLLQAKQFGTFISLDGAILTKLDGTAKGGIIFPLYKELKIPVLFIGVGEDIIDLEPFDPNEYLDGLLGSHDKSQA
ncbi:MAG: signal recognition particle-docking protein FtsY [Candidatus Neomarinimicrobiota bacterium]|nr:signal recognition particle-docking protein FtsY [Candidatus Neomarinimicrobiota bacterium]